MGPAGSGRARWGRRPLVALLLAVALVAAACTGGGSDAASDDGGDPADAGETATTIGGESTEVLSADQVDERDLRYRCDSVLFGPDDAVAGEVDTAQGTAVIESLGTALPSWLVGVEPDGLVPCLARNATVTDLRPVAFEIVDGAVAIEGCVAPDDVVVDRREIDGVTVMTVFGPQVEDPAGVVGAECAVDGSNVLDDDTVGDVSGTVLSGVTYPFAVPSAALHEQLGYGVGLADLPAVDPASVLCRALPGTDAVEVSWTGLEPGYRASVRVGSEVLFTSEPSGADTAPSVMEAYALAMFDRGTTLVVPEYVHAYADYNAPGDPRLYVIDVFGGSGDAATVVCGEAGRSGGSTPLLDPADQPNTLGGELGSAKSLFDATAMLPYVYMTIEPICDGCPGDPIRLTLSPSGTDARTFDPPVEQQADPSLPGLVDPFGLHALLDAAEGNGREVSYVLDPSSGVPVEWTIDGRGARITCLELDIAPPDLRVSEGCRTDLDIIGR